MISPIELQKKMYDNFEKNMGKAIEKTLRDETYLKLVSQWWQLGFNWLDLTRKCAKPMLDSVDVPTNSSLDKLYQSVHSMEMRLLDLEEKVDEDIRRPLVKETPES